MRRERFGSSGVAAAADGSSGAGPVINQESIRGSRVRSCGCADLARSPSRLSARSEWAGASPCPYPYAIVPWHIARRHGHAHCHPARAAASRARNAFNVATARTAPIARLSGKV